jgi:predicted SnoaL-like aldol condensation-catalyzing enzyme
MTTRSQRQETNKVVGRRLAEEVFSQGNMQTFDAIFADTYANHNMPVPGIPGTKKGFRQVVAATRQAFPDVHVNVQDMVAEGDFVVFRDTVQATSRGDFLGRNPATGAARNLAK